MKRLTSIILTLAIGALTSLHAQSVDGATYALPKTGVKLTMLVEKSVYTPGQLAKYARKFLRDTEVDTEPATSYRLLSGEMRLYAEPDTSKVHTAHIDQKHNIQGLALSANTCLQAVNADAVKTTQPRPFQPSYQPKPLDPNKYLSQDILSAGSEMKMAELIAKEIYDIRESRNELTRGQAEYMPKDGEQLKVMLASLEQQEQALRQMFTGYTRVDTTETTLSYMPRKGVEQDVLFRFSKHYGLVEADDLSGEPYIIKVEDLKSAPEPIVEPGKKPAKDETGIWINLPGRVHVSVLDNDCRVWQQIDFAAGQYGNVENLNDPLFTKKVLTRLVLNPYNGGIETIDSAPIK